MNALLDLISVPQSTQDAFSLAHNTSMSQLIEHTDTGLYMYLRLRRPY
jgi:hypothetical protein